MVEFGRWGFFRLDLRGRRLSVLEQLASRIVVLGEGRRGEVRVRGGHCEMKKSDLRISEEMDMEWC